MPNAKIVLVFREVDELIKHSQFELQDLEFMEKYLEAALEATKKVLARVRKGKATE